MKKSRLRGKAKARAEMKLPKSVELATALTQDFGVSFLSKHHIPVTQFFNELRRCAFITDFAERYSVDPKEIDTVLRAANLLVMESFTGKRLLAAAEVVHQLRRALAGEVTVRLADPRHTWDAAYCTNCRVYIGDWDFQFFNDAGRLDYVDTVISPTGRWVQFREFEPGEHPLFDDLLTSDEQRALERLLEAAR